MLGCEIGQECASQGKPRKRPPEGPPKSCLDDRRSTKSDGSLRATAGQARLTGSELPTCSIFYLFRASNSKRRRSISQAPSDGSGRGMGLRVASCPRPPGRIANLCACGTRAC
ncbi:hypothetical protein CDEST_08238 [Colletotrichum destructivum]|uniref:Uncharacterized protein n=1 Tax=Colletotrichum destructivum TaxID=34406 RepID=A0AAX4IIP1_9PEZI|nr:hypothetical protein CDEST_08238 [Colletotrichum destructivum]